MAQLAQPAPDPSGERAAAPSGPPEPALEKIEAWIEGFYELLPNLGVAAVVFLLVVLAGSGARWLVLRWGRRRGRENLGEVLGSFVKWAIAGVGLLIVAAIVLPSVRPVDLLAGFGVGSIAFGFAFKDILQNWLAGLLLLFREPFQVGDQIVVGSHEGTVERIETRATNIRTYDGRRILIPNSEVYTQAVVINTAFGTRRNEYQLGIGYGDDIRQVRQLILASLRQVDGVEHEPEPVVLAWSLDPSWVTLKIWWWTQSRRVDVVLVRARVIEAIKDTLDEARIEFPFPTVVEFWHDKTAEAGGARATEGRRLVGVSERHATADARRD